MQIQSPEVIAFNLGTPIGLFSCKIVDYAVQLNDTLLFNGRHYSLPGHNSKIIIIVISGLFLHRPYFPFGFSGVKHGRGSGVLAKPVAVQNEFPKRHISAREARSDPRAQSRKPRPKGVVDPSLFGVQTQWRCSGSRRGSGRDF